MRAYSPLNAQPGVNIFRMENKKMTIYVRREGGVGRTIIARANRLVRNDSFWIFLVKTKSSNYLTRRD